MGFLVKKNELAVSHSPALFGLQAWFRQNPEIWCRITKNQEVSILENAPIRVGLIELSPLVEEAN